MKEMLFLIEKNIVKNIKKKKKNMIKNILKNIKKKKKKILKDVMKKIKKKKKNNLKNIMNIENLGEVIEEEIIIYYLLILLCLINYFQLFNIGRALNRYRMSSINRSLLHLKGYIREFMR